jgi:hypothetical protein
LIVGLTIFQRLILNQNLFDLFHLDHYKKRKFWFLIADSWGETSPAKSIMVEGGFFSFLLKFSDFWTIKKEKKKSKKNLSSPAIVSYHLFASGPFFSKVSIQNTLTWFLTYHHLKIWLQIKVWLLVSKNDWQIGEILFAVEKQFVFDYFDNGCMGGWVFTFIHLT